MRGAVCRVLIAAVAIFAAVLGVGASERSHTLSDGMKRPVRTHVSFSIIDILKLQETSGEVSAIVEVQQRWQDPAVRFNAIVAGSQRLDYAGDEATDKLAKIWTPAILIENQIGEPRSLTSSVSIYADGRVQLTERIEADFRFANDLSAFPFDTQRIPFSFLSQYHPADEVILVVDDADRALSTYASNLTASDWSTRTLTFQNEQLYGWNAKPFVRLKAEIAVARNWPRYVLRIFVPFLAVLSVSLFILWGAIGDRPGITYSALLALAALGFTFEASFPGSMSVNSPIAFMISIGYFYLILTLVIDLVLESNAFPGRTAYPHLASETRRAVRHLLPALFAIICACIVLRSLA